MKNYIYKVRYANENVNAYESFSIALNEYKTFKNTKGEWKAIELYRLDVRYGLVKTLRGTAL